MMPIAGVFFFAYFLPKGGENTTQSLCVCRKHMLVCLCMECIGGSKIIYSGTTVRAGV